jgi:hypothetical protein
MHIRDDVLRSAAAYRHLDRQLTSRDSRRDLEHLHKTIRLMSRDVPNCILRLRSRDKHTIPFCDT